MFTSRVGDLDKAEVEFPEILPPRQFGDALVIEFCADKTERRQSPQGAKMGQPPAGDLDGI